MGLETTMKRPVRIRQEESDIEESFEGSSDDLDIDSEIGTKGGLSDEDYIEVSHTVEHLKSGIESVSFGALAGAQSSIGKRKRLSGDAALDPKVVQTLRAGLREMQVKQRGSGHARAITGMYDAQGVGESGRSSKHSPAEMSSKKAVSRKREVVPTTKRNFRDPRFEPLSGPVNETRLRQNYSFLDNYQADERNSLKQEIKRTKDEPTKESLKRALLSMESKKTAQDARDKQQEIVRSHRSEEKKLIKQGKKPFYLKHSEQKRLALVDRYSKMKGKQLDRALERKRKKAASKARRNMPAARRGTEA